MTQPHQTFGASLSSHREAAGMTLADVAQQTKVPLHALECLERGLFEELPGDVFVRGFLRSYARCVGLDPEDTVRDFGELMTAPEDTVVDAHDDAGSDASRPVDAAGADADEPSDVVREPVTIESIARAILAIDGNSRMPLRIAVPVLAVVATIAMALLMLSPG